MQRTIIHTLARVLDLRRTLTARTAGSGPGTAGACPGSGLTLAASSGVDPDPEAGMATAEYAVGTLAAAAFAGLLLAVMRSGSLQGVLQGLIESALSVG
ncbi:DUF4244 domain-containing protein [Actinomyces faecalis]|uniref:DUF4244 domain-containing protein n=1 Tax=Actinomyces faecalis TaxID=2722820 RepID=UPI001551A797|nr:DUF4244 domain-containing protein [Actinomyces faecalis]